MTGNAGRPVVGTRASDIVIDDSIPQPRMVENPEEIAGMYIEKHIDNIHK
jgi:hypothetical protein